MPSRRLPPLGTALTPRERQVLAGQARGLTRPQIAAELGISASTVGVLERFLYARLGVRCGAQAVDVAVRRGVIAPAPQGPAHRPLTWAEERLVPLVAAGLSNAEAGARLGLSGITVKSHLVRVFAAVRARSRAHLVARAHELGILKPGRAPLRPADGTTPPTTGARA